MTLLATYSQLGTASAGTSVPSSQDFGELASSRRVTPVVRRIPAESETPVGLYFKLTGNDPGSFLLESAENGDQWSRYSFIGVTSQAVLTERDGKAHWLGDVPEAIDLTTQSLSTISQVVNALHSDRIDELPPLTSGLVGYLSYDTVRRWEKIDSTTIDDLKLPEFAMFLATELAVLDHQDGSILLISNVFSSDKSDPDQLAKAYDDANAKLDILESKLANSIVGGHSVYEPISEFPDVSSTMAKSEFCDKVEQVREYIKSGDAYQVVLSQRFERASSADPLEVYRMLRELNPSPYMYLFRFPESVLSEGGSDEKEAFSVVGSSPEALVKLEGGRALLHPIAGTRPRGDTEEQDVANGEELLEDAKELAEHLMLVDLGRNDLGRVCRPGSVDVIEFMNVERYSHVMHIVSTVVGELDEGLDAYDLLRATFPAGTLSGAPKVRAMEIIDELETTSRAIYAGCVGYIDFSGDMDTAIAIRTAVMKDGRAYVQAGAGLVADSDAEAEYEETRSKASAVLRAIVAAESVEAMAVTEVKASDCRLI